MRKFNLVIHLVVNCCLLLVVGIVVCGCGLFSSGAVSTFKSYRGVIYAGNENSNKVALMINVYWGEEYLEQMLDTLQEEDVKATFFVGKTFVEKNPKLVQRIYNEGHEIGSHGSNHKDHAKLSASENASEIQQCHDIVFRLLNIEMNLFAPPSGSYSETTVKVASELGYKTILWTHDTIDWRDQDEKLIYERATSEVASGDLILMHPTKATSDALKNIIETIKSKKLALDTVSNTIKD